MTDAQTKMQNEGFMDRLLQEYWNLQEKVDAIGDFRFRVKGWVVALSGGLVVAMSQMEDLYYVSVLVALPLVWTFWFLEHYYSTLQKVFTTRISEIEEQINSLFPFTKPGSKKRLRSPNLAKTIRSSKAMKGWIRYCHLTFYILISVSIIAIAMMI